MTERVERCQGCAYTTGTAAARDAVTSLTRELCVQARHPFLCHANGERQADGSLRVPDGQEEVCRGYLDACAATRPAPTWARAIAEEGLRLMEDIADGSVLDRDEITRRCLAAGAAAAGGVR